MNTPKPSWRQTLSSVVAAFFGVQSDNNRQRDFTASSPWPYIIAGLLFIACFIGAVAAVVAWVMP